MTDLSIPTRRTGERSRRAAIVARLGGRGPALAFAAVLALALALRIGVLLGTPHFAPATDALDFDRHGVSLARQHRYPSTLLAAGGGPTAFRPPGYPAFLGAVYAVSGTGHAGTRWQAARAAQVVLGLAVVALVGLIVALVWDRRTALVAVGLAAVYPPLLLAGSSLISEALFLPLELAAVAAALALRRSPQPLAWALAAGALAGLAALTRSNGIVLLLALAIAAWPSRRLTGGRGWAPAAALIAAALVVIAPWSVRNVHEFHAFVPISTQDGFAFAGTYSDIARHDRRAPGAWRPPIAVPAYARIIATPGLDEEQVDRRLRSASLRYAERHPAYLAAVAGHNLPRMLNLEGVGYERQAAADLGIARPLSDASVYGFWVVLALAAAGLATQAARRAPWFLWLVPVLMTLSILFVSALTRYRLPADPFLLLAAALALVAAHDRARGRRAPAASPAGTAARRPPAER